MYNPVSSDVTGWKIHHLYPFIDVFFSYKPPFSSGIFHWLRRWWQQRVFWVSTQNQMGEIQKITWLKQINLVGGLEHGFYFSIWECHNPNWQTPSFFRGVSSNHQAATVSGRRGQVTFRHPPLKPMKMPGLSALAPWSSGMRSWAGGKKNRWGTATNFYVVSVLSYGIYIYTATNQWYIYIYILILV